MNLYQHGMDLTMVSQWLGRANLSTALIYVHAFPKVSAEESSYDVKDDSWRFPLCGLPSIPLVLQARSSCLGVPFPSNGNCFYSKLPLAIAILLVGI